MGQIVEGLLSFEVSDEVLTGHAHVLLVTILPKYVEKFMNLSD